MREFTADQEDSIHQLSESAYMDIGADAFKEDNAIWGGLIPVHVLPWHFNVHQALLLQTQKPDFEENYQGAKSLNEVDSLAATLIRCSLNVSIAIHFVNSKDTRQKSDCKYAAKPNSICSPQYRSCMI